MTPSVTIRSDKFSVGALVRARGREWVVLPESEPDAHFLVLRPLGGRADEDAGIDTRLEPVSTARFELPNPAVELGNHRSGALLRDAVRLGFRAGAGPFRGLARIAIEPRPYQLVPLLMALRQDPVRLLIADDVGVGKTIEACLIARELLDRGEIRRTAVLCPPHLAEQWQRTLEQQFHIPATLLLASTAARLERTLALGESIFDRHPHVVISLDYIKSERRRNEFLRVCPEFVIVDEAHACAAGFGRTAQLRHELLRQVSHDPARHLVLVTATPHSGDESQFRSLLTLLDPELGELPADLSGDVNRKHRERLARHLVQRRRPDLRDYLSEETPFPHRDISEETYRLSPAYRKLLDRVLEFCREQVRDVDGTHHRQRVRWWSALALLRALASSPLAAVTSLRNRAATSETDTADEADAVGRRTVLDQGEAEAAPDLAPGAQQDDDEHGQHRRRLLALARDAEALVGADDNKLTRVATIISDLLNAGSSPIVFCRFIPTAEYVAIELKKRLGKTFRDLEVFAVTGTLPPEDREKRVAELGEHPRRVLVCTDCLSEGINLQQHFDAVLHYDLSWNPTRHEQREGRVDRYGQPSPNVQTITFYGQDNPIDGIVLEVLLRKHKAIHAQLGITVPVPMDTDAVVDAIFQGLLLRDNSTCEQVRFDFAEPERHQVEKLWDAAVDRERRSRSIFAQRTIDVDEVRSELLASRAAIGGEPELRRFVHTGLEALGATLNERRGVLEALIPADLPGLRERLDASTLRVAFHPPAPTATEVLTRTHPRVEALASFLLEAALDPIHALDPRLREAARRCALVRTRAVQTRTTLIVLRLRFHLVHRDRAGVDHTLLAEDTALAGFRGAPDRAEWLPESELEPLLHADAAANTAPEHARAQLASLVEQFPLIAPHLATIADTHGHTLLAAHRRVRKAASLGGLRHLRIETYPPDVLGLYIYLPVPVGGAA